MELIIKKEIKMLPITYTYEKQRFADILRHVEAERRRMDPMMTMPAPKHPHPFQVISTALLQLVSFLLG
jgi:hypothetical protein